MDYATAKAIINELYPEFEVDDFNPELKSTIQVRKTKTSTPFCIGLPRAIADGFQPIEARAPTPDQPAIEPTDDHPGRPAIPGEPAVKARTVEGQIAEHERDALISSLKAAKEHIG